MMIQILMHF